MKGIPSQRGLIPRSFQHIFESISVAENTKFLVRASYLEIYNEEIRDLLAVNSKQKLDLKENPDRGVYVKSLSHHQVSSGWFSLESRSPTSRNSQLHLCHQYSSSKFIIFHRMKTILSY